MATNSTQGTLLQLSIASVFTTVAQRTKITPATSTRAKIETTDLDSTAETSIPGILRAGEYTLEANYDPSNATHAAVWASFSTGNGTVEAWKVILADTGAAVFAFSAWVSEFTVGEAETDKVQRFTAKFTVTGPITLTP